MCTLTTLKIILEVPAIAQAKKIHKRHMHLNERNKTAVLLYNGMIVYLENPMELTENFL